MRYRSAFVGIIAMILANIALQLSSTSTAFAHSNA